MHVSIYLSIYVSMYLCIYLCILRIPTRIDTLGCDNVLQHATTVRAWDDMGCQLWGWDSTRHGAQKLKAALAKMALCD